jgi:hypothetical protein
MSQQKDKIYTTTQQEGWERPVVLVIVPTGTGNISYLCYSWGTVDGHVFFDLINDNRIEIHGDLPYLIHCPNKGLTFELDGTCRELHREEPLVVVQ